MGDYGEWDSRIVIERTTSKSKPFAFIFLTVFSSLLFTLLVALIFLYIAGNYQDFLDRNLILILKMSIFVSIILFFISSVSFFVDCYLLITKRRLSFFLTLLISFMFIVVSIVFSFVNTLIIVIS